MRAEDVPEEWLSEFMREFYRVDAGFTDTVRACLAAVAPLIAAEALKERDMETLKPCPFCGGEAKLKAWMGLDFVGCLACKATGPQFDDHSPVAIAAWNRRAGEGT